MASKSLGLVKVENIYVTRLGLKGRWAESSLQAAILRFDWSQLTFEELSSGPRELVRAKLLATTAKNKAEATRDFGRLELFRNSGPTDLWISFVNNEMWWTRLVAGPIERDGESSFRRTAGWSNHSLAGDSLEFANLSEQVRRVNRTSPSAAKAVRDDGARGAILAQIRGTEASLPQAVSEAVAGAPDEYVPMFGDLGARSVPVDNRLEPLEISIQEMVENAGRAAAESGQIRERVLKVKEVRMSSDELSAHIRELVERQGRRCKLTKLPLHFGSSKMDDGVDSERLASLDRIDSDGHYERGNLQVVCRFVNRWKSDDRQENFVRLLRLVVAGDESR